MHSPLAAASAAQSSITCLNLNAELELELELRSRHTHTYHPQGSRAGRSLETPSPPVRVLCCVTPLGNTGLSLDRLHVRPQSEREGKNNTDRVPRSRPNPPHQCYGTCCSRDLITCCVQYPVARRARGQLGRRARAFPSRPAPPWAHGQDKDRTAAAAATTKTTRTEKGQKRAPPGFPPFRRWWHLIHCVGTS